MIHVSKHAIARYQERVRPVSAAEAEAAILSHMSALECADRLGGATVRSSDGVRYIVKDGSVVTVIGQECRFNHPRKAA